MDDKQLRQQINLKDPAVIALLEKTGRRWKSLLITLAVNEFAEKYGIDETSSHEEILQLLKNYSYVRQLSRNMASNLPVLLRPMAQGLENASAQMTGPAERTNEAPVENPSDIASFFDSRRKAAADSDNPDAISMEDARTMEHILSSFSQF